MKLIRLDIRHLPGIDRPFSVEFSPSTVNVVTGPNGSGKSSLARAVRALIHVARDDPHIEVAAVWQDNEGELRSERIGQSVQWQRRGQSVKAPPLPSQAAMGAYLISSEDLTAPGTTDAHISEEVQTLLAGGYDLSAVLAAPPFAVPPRPQKLAREIESSQRTIAAKEAEYAELDAEIEKLGRLEAGLEEASRSAILLSAIDDAQALAEAHSARAALEQTLIEEFPGGMDRLRGDEMQRLDQARARLEQKQQAIHLEREAHGREQKELEQRGGKDPTLLESMQAQLAEARDALATTEQQLTTVEEQVELKRDAAAAAAQRLGSTQPEHIEQLDQGALESLERQVEKVLAQREKLRALSGQLVLGQQARNPSSRLPDDLRTARRALQEWLALARLSPLEGALWGSLALAAVLGSIRVLSAETLSTHPELLLLAALAVGLPLAMLGRFVLRYRDREGARTLFLRTAIEAPMGWSEAEVRARLERVEAELEAAVQHELGQMRAAELREQLNAQRVNMERARDRLRKLADQFGISADPRLETGFLLWCRHLQDWQQAHQELNALILRGRRLRQRLRQQIEQASQLLQRHGVDATDLSSRTLATLVHELQPRIRRCSELYSSLQAREKRLDDLSADVVQIQQQIRLLFEGAGIRQDDIPALRQRVEQHPAWQQLEQQRRDLTHEIARLEKRLQDHPGLLELARRQQRSELEAQRHEHARRAEQRDQLNRYITEIRTRHSETLKRRDLERMGAELEQLHERLGAELEAQMIAAAGHYLIEDIRSAYRLQHEPALLAAADRWLDTFTRHRYRLLFEDGEFLAIDTLNDRRHPLDQLSTGGRAQFMLAVRLAWIEQQEQQNEPLPVFMDEVLTTSDADRYRAVVGAVRTLIDNGRQLFYLTAQSDDAQAWWEWLGEGLEPHAVDMAKVRKDDIRQLEFHMPARARPAEPIPDPEQMDRAQWAKAVGVPAIDPWQNAGQIHVAHLLSEELPLARRLMEAGVNHLGELQRLLQHAESNNTAGLPLDNDDLERLRALTKAGRLFLNDWREHHDRPVDMAALHATGLLSDRFLPRVAELAAELGGDPKALLQRLGEGAVPRFRSEVNEQLGEWLQDQGYLGGGTSTPSMTAADLAMQTGLSIEQSQVLLQALSEAVADPLRRPVESA